MSKLTKVWFAAGATILTLVAFMTSASACWWSSYQAETPKCMREE